jgi:membrane-associated phospholipid phosphatase
MDSIIGFDQHVFLWIQHHCSSAFLDQVMPWIRSKPNWYPLYVILAILIFRFFKINAVKIIVVVVICVGISDLIGSVIIKPAVKRLRPCDDPVVSQEFTPKIKCGNRGYSFTSNHASNHFALAFSLALFFKKNKRLFLWLGGLWAGLIAFAQVYVGVHYPLDVICGALTGISIAFFIHFISARYLHKLFQFNS